MPGPDPVRKKKPAPAPMPPRPAGPKADSKPAAIPGAGGVRLWKSEITCPQTTPGTTSASAKTSVINDSGHPIKIDRIVDETDTFPAELELYGFAENTTVEPGSRFVLELAYTPKRTGEYETKLEVHLSDGQVLDLVVRASAYSKGKPVPADAIPAKAKELALGGSGTRSSKSRMCPSKSTEGLRKVTPIKEEFGNVLGAIRTGAETALANIDGPQEPPSSRTTELLALAASFAITAGAAGVGAAIAQGLRATVGLVAAKAVADMAKRAIKDTYKAAVDRGQELPQFGTLKYRFHQAHIDKLDDAEPEAMDAFACDLSPLLELQTLEVLARIKQRFRDMREDVKNMQRRLTMVGWTNFLAQYHHGGSAADGSVSSEVVRKQGLLQNTQRFLLEEHTGLLEVDIGFQTHRMEGGKRGISSEPWGLSLSGAGENVKSTIRELGTVRNVPVNRIIRGFWIGHTRLDPALPAITVMVTPDNAVSDVNKRQEHVASLDDELPPEPPVSGQELFEMAADVPLKGLK